METATATTTYNRKYYLIRKVKAAGYQFYCRDNERQIVVPLERYGEAKRDPAITELMEDFGYGVQIGTISVQKQTNAMSPAIKAKKGLWSRIKEWIIINW